MKTISNLELHRLQAGAYDKSFWHGFSCTVGIIATASSFYALTFPPLAGSLVLIGFIGTTGCAMTSPKYD